MKWQTAIICVIFYVLPWARAEGPDDRYVQIYNLIQEADGLNDAGQTREAAIKYFDADKALKALQAEFPDWNGNVVKFRLGYIASKLEPLAGKLPLTNTTPAIVIAPPAPASASPTNEMKDLQEEIKRLTGQNALLEAKLKEALSVQPAPMDPRELAKAEEKIKNLEKEKELLKVTLEQEKAKTPKTAELSVTDQEKQILADVKQRLAQETELVASLQKENENLKAQLAASKPSSDNPSSDLSQQLQTAKATISTLQTSNLNLRTDQLLLESRLADLSRQTAKRGSSSRSKERSNTANQQLQAALARLSVYEAKPIPYTVDELAAFKQADLKVNLAETASIKHSVKELPPGAGPIMEQAHHAEEAGRFDEAEKKFLEVLHQDERNIYVLGSLAAVQIEQERLADAEKTITQALAIDPRDPACLFTMGFLKYRQEKYDAALDSLSLAASMLPEEPRTQFFLGKVLLAKGNRAAAETALRKAVQLRPGWGDAHFSLAMVYATQQPPFKELAQWHYKQAIVSGYPRNLEFEKLLEEKKTSVPGS